MNKELAKRGVKPQYVKGNRVTDDATLAGMFFPASSLIAKQLIKQTVAQKVFTELNGRIVDSLQQAGE